MLLENKIALVTGASSGIGLAVAQRFTAEGAEVVLTARSSARLTAAASMLGSRAVAIAADLAAVEDIEQLIAEVRQRFGRLDVLVLNAGMSNAPALKDLDAETYERLMAVNCRAVALTLARALPILADGASVVLIGSVAERKGQPGDALYAGSKGFIRAFGRTAGTDPALLARGIRVNVVAPGPIDTPLTQMHTADPGVRAYINELVPMRRMGLAEEVANAVLFLASGQSSFTTGAELTVDGGLAHA